MKCLICDTFEATIGTKSAGLYLCDTCVDKSELVKCPECGGEVFIPMIGWIKRGTQVVCSYMGHWGGRLAECSFPVEWHDDWM